MTASEVGYENVHAWVKALLKGAHSTVVVTVAWAVLCLVVAQRVTPAALARAIPASAAGSARSRLRRVRRWWQGPELPVERLTPRLLRAALALLPPGATVTVALDTTRVGPWEIWHAGLVFAGHTLPLAWAVVPYPWPKGRFRDTTLSLVQQLQRAMPVGHRWALVADRGFPNAQLFDHLRTGHTDWTVRLRLSTWVEVADVYAPVSAHLQAGRLRPGERVAATLGRGTAEYPRVQAWIVVSAAVPLPPKHKRNPGTERERAARAKAQAKHREQKGRKSRPPSALAQQYAQTWVLFTSAPSLSAAVDQYAARMAIEQTFRDWHHGWGLRVAAAPLPTAGAVSRLVGSVCLAYRLQVELGLRFSTDTQGQRRRAQWTVSDRLSYFWCGQHLLWDPGADWSAWLAAQWDDLLTPDAATALVHVA
jgi:hypothetical protein